MTSEIQASSPTPPPAEAASSRKGGFQRIIGVLFSPGETFREIAARPDFLAPVLVILLISIGSSIVIAPRVDFESAIREKFEESGQMSPADVDRAVRFASAFSKAMIYAAPVVNFIFFAVVAGVFLLVFRLFGGEGGFKQAFSVTLYAWMPMIIAGLIGMIILVARGSVPADQLNNLVMSNLGFLADPKENMVAFALLSSIDLFVIWSLALFIIGFAHVSRMTTGKSAAIVLSLWAGVLLFKVGFAAMGAARMKS